MTAALAIGAAILLAMAGVSCYGWITLPSDALVPVHFGSSYNNFVPKRLGLVMHPAAGALVFVLMTVAGHVSPGSGGHEVPLAVILPLVMFLLLAVQAGAIRVARRRPGGF